METIKERLSERVNELCAELIAERCGLFGDISPELSFKLELAEQHLANVIEEWLNELE
jgi:hypothetical protein